MRAFFSKSRICLVIAGIAVATALGGCGSASNNDQGVAFNLLGFFASGDGSCEALPTGDLGRSIPYGEFVDESAGADGGVLTYIGLQNSMTQQFIRTDRVFISYSVEGADAQPPSTSLPLSIFLRPSDPSVDNPFGSTLPPGYSGGAQCQFGQFFVLPPEIRTWFNFNRTVLPEPPFLVLAEVYVSGVTSSGDRLDSNVATYDFYITPDPIIPPTESTDSGSSAGVTSGDTATGGDSSTDSGDQGL